MLFVGTIHQHPKEWIIVGLFYPPREAVLPLIDAAEDGDLLSSPVVEHEPDGPARDPSLS